MHPASWGGHYTRRDFLRLAALAALPGAEWKTAAAETITLPFENGERPLVRYPQKRPLIQRSARSRRTAWQWRHGQCPLERGSLARCFAQSGRGCRRETGHVQRPGPAAGAENSRFREGAGNRPRALA